MVKVCCVSGMLCTALQDQDEGAPREGDIKVEDADS